MTWTWLSDSFYDDPTLLAADRDARLMFVEVLTWANRYLTDGAIPTAALARITDSPDPESAADALVKAGLWSATENGWQVTDWTGIGQQTAEEVERKKEEAEFRKVRSRQHKADDHTLCRPEWCKGAKLLAEAGVIPPEGAKPGTRDKTRDRMRAGTPSHPNPTRPDPTGRDRGRVGSSAGARPGGSLCVAADGEGAWPEPGGDTVILRFPDEGQPPVMTVRNPKGGARPTDIEVMVTRPRDAHVRIVLSNVSGSPVIANAVIPVLHRLVKALRSDIHVVLEAHGCAKHGEDRMCLAEDATTDDPPAASVSFKIPTNRHQTWLDLISYELVRIGPPQFPSKGATS